MTTAYQTTTNDPEILVLVDLYRAARDTADAAVRRSIDAGIDDLEAAADMQASQELLNRIQDKLCVLFVGALEQTKSQKDKRVLPYEKPTLGEDTRRVLGDDLGKEL